jgi:hypothetical protein
MTDGIMPVNPRTGTDGVRAAALDAALGALLLTLFMSVRRQAGMCCCEAGWCPVPASAERAPPVRSGLLVIWGVGVGVEGAVMR